MSRVVLHLACNYVSKGAASAPKKSRECCFGPGRELADGLPETFVQGRPCVRLRATFETTVRPLPRVALMVGSVPTCVALRLSFMIEPCFNLNMCLISHEAPGFVVVFDPAQIACEF